MSHIPPYQMGSPDGGPPLKQKSKSVWIWVVAGCAGMCVICGIVGAVVLVPVAAQAQQAARERSSLNMAKQISKSVFMYSADNDDHFPPFDNGPAISDRLDGYISSISHTSVATKVATSVRKKAATSTWNKELSGAEESSIENPNDVWMFTTDEPAEFKSINIGFAGGTTIRVHRKEVASKTAGKPKFSETSKK